MFASTRTSLFGAQLSGGLPLPLAKMHLRGDLGGSWQTVDDELGSVQLSIASLGIAALFMTTGQPVAVLGPRIEVGYSYGSGTTERLLTHTDSDRRVFIGGSVVAGLHTAVLGPLSAVLEIEVGVAVRGHDVFADNRRIASTNGAFLGARLGIGYVY